MIKYRGKMFLRYDTEFKVWDYVKGARLRDRLKNRVGVVKDNYE
jgi:hypothetical protein